MQTHSVITTTKSHTINQLQLFNNTQPAKHCAMVSYTMVKLMSTWRTAKFARNLAIANRSWSASCKNCVRYNCITKCKNRRIYTLRCHLSCDDFCNYAQSLHCWKLQTQAVFLTI